ncbi:MAG: hypothetical protein COC09_08705 [Gammaproteobacteria bacterium]|nr:HAMP domain-containing histidine kinase [Gammaproteobacteria bacterium]PCH62384.1 MAG: hypothetical protein COC09_08705 [Gammaproteobacteria bacterium]
MSSNNDSTGAEIQRLRKEIEDFTHIVSHDLNAPIRHVLQFSLLLEQRLSSREILTQEEQQFLEIISGAATRARNMIDALLGLSRSTSSDLNIEPLALNELLERVRSALNSEHPEKEIFIDYSDFSQTVDADRASLEIALKAIIDNCVCFCSDDSPAKISINIAEHNGHVQLDILDNGPGIPKKLAERVFQCFYQIDPDPEDADHVGIGLTLARRIAHRHNGNLTMEAKKEGADTDQVWPRLSLPLKAKAI